MATFDQTVGMSQEKTYSIAEKYLGQRGDFHITQRTKNSSIYAEGTRDINPVAIGVGLLLGIIFIILIWPLGLIIFIIVAAVYATSATNSIHFDVQADEADRSNLSVTTNGRDAAKAAETIVEKLKSSVEGDTAATVQESDPENE